MVIFFGKVRPRESGGIWVDIDFANAPWRLSRTFARLSPHLKAAVSKLAVLPALFAILNGTCIARAQENAAPLNTNSAFVSYLRNPPWIKEVRFKRSQFVRVSANATHPKATNLWVIESYQAAMQPSGFYSERLPFPLPPPLSSPHYTNGLGANGTSKNYYWAGFYGGNGADDARVLYLEPQPSEPGASEKNGVHTSLEFYREHLEGIRFLGFPLLRPDSFQIGAGNSFTAVKGNGDRLDGRILEANKNRPTTLVYTNMGIEVLVKYEYPEGQPLPNSFEIIQNGHGKLAVPPQTNWIDQIEYGLNDSITNGYSPAMLFADMSKFNHIVVWSNGVDYTLGPHGDMFARNHTPPPAPMVAGVALKNPSAARWVMMAIIFASCAVAWASIRRAKDRST